MKTNMRDIKISNLRSLDDFLSVKSVTLQWEKRVTAPTSKRKSEVQRMKTKAVGGFYQKESLRLPLPYVPVHSLQSVMLSSQKSCRGFLMPM